MAAMMSPRIPALAAAIAIAVATCDVSAAAFDVEGHRGARGLAPENTIAAFERALALGVTTLEADLAVTRDDVVVVSHNPRLNPELTRDASGRYLAGEGPPIRSLTLAEVLRYDVGRTDPASKYGQGFPMQTPRDGERIPTLDALLALAARSDRPVRLNIETKITPDQPDDAPAPDQFVALVAARVRAAALSSRVTLQSFDWRTLVAAQRLAPELKRACLTQETSNSNNVAARDGRASPWTAGFDLRDAGGSVPRLVKSAGCHVWSPFHRNATPERIAEAHALGLEVLPWTVNDPADMRRLIESGVDGLISDYPDRLLEVLRDVTPRR
jgi:glycerophosphoryl diester phosphodiesterase